VQVEGVLQPAPAPRFSRTPLEISSSAPARGANTEEVLTSNGFTPAEVKELREARVVS
jgi:alpha-methylacyl-CoA racemase